MNSSASFVVPSLLVWLVLSLASSGAMVKNAADQGHEKVSMQGSIIDTLCAIAMASREQMIDLITIPL